MQTKDLTKEKKLTSPKSRAEEVIDKNGDVVGSRSNFESYWQSLHDYFYVESENINRAYYSGTELDFTDLWDTTSLEAADVLASGFMSYLTPPGSKWFNLRTKNPALMESKPIANYLQDIEAEIYHMLNNSNFYFQINPSYKASGVFGTSILLEEDDYKDGARFYNLPLKQVGIVEDGRGRVVEYYITFEYTPHQALTRFGEEKLTTEMKLKMNDRKADKKYPYILYIGERARRKFDQKNKENMPIEALWVDKTAKTIVEEGGYNEMPAMAHRFNKRSFIPWGFSPAMKALPMARIANTIAKTNLRTMMKHTDPPIAVPNNSFIMPFNGNPRAINYYKAGSMDSKSIFPFANTGNPEVGLTALEYYNHKVKTLMYNDVFLAFSQVTKQMNNPEIMERINEKMTLLGPAVGRYMGEVLDPIIKRSIGILFRAGRLPEPPDEMVTDPRYEIEYVSMLAQAQKRTEMNSLMTALQVVGQMAQISPEVLDKVNPDKTVDQVWGITGAPVHILRDDEEVAKIRENRAQQQAETQKMMMISEGVKAVEGASKVEKNLADAKRGG